MRGIIWYKDECFNGLEKLKDIVKKYEQVKIPTVRVHYSTWNAYAEFENGDIWRVKKAHDFSRGHRCNIAYVERSIDYETYRCIIAPSMSDFPYSAIRLWGEGNLHITDNIIPQLPF